jgi:hypothetical protein
MTPLQIWLPLGNSKQKAARMRCPKQTCQRTNALPKEAVLDLFLHESGFLARRHAIALLYIPMLKQSVSRGDRGDFTAMHMHDSNALPALLKATISTAMRSLLAWR